jgi:prevent-host-death family protein
MLQVDVERTIPLQEAQSRLKEIVQEAASGQIWVITQNDQPQAAVIDVRYLDALLQQTWPEGEAWYRLVQASLARVWDHPDEDIYTLTDGEPL